MLLQIRVVVCIYDSVLFLWHSSNIILSGMMVSLVDDFTFCGDQQFQNKVIGGLKERFIVNTHDAYINTLEPINISPSRNKAKQDDLSHEERVELRRLSGQMLWVTSQTRPDLSFETCMMSNTGKHPKVSMLFEANKALSKLKKDRIKLKFPFLGDSRKLSVSVFLMRLMQVWMMGHLKEVTLCF